MNVAGELSSRGVADVEARPRRRLQRLLRWTIGVLASLLLLLAVLVLFRDVIFKALLVQHFQHELGMRAEVGEFRTGLANTVIHVRNFKVFNSPEFGGSLLAEVPELFVQVDTEPLANGLIHLKELRVNLSEFNVVRNGNGRTNLEKAQKAWRERLRRKREKKDKVQWDFGGIDQLQVSVGKIGFTDLQRPSLSRNFHLDLHDEKRSGLENEELIQSWAGALLLRSLAQDSLRPAGDRKLPTLEWLLGWTGR